MGRGWRLGIWEFSVGGTVQDLGLLRLGLLLTGGKWGISGLDRDYISPYLPQTSSISSGLQGFGLGGQLSQVHGAGLGQF